MSLSHNHVVKVDKPRLTICHSHLNLHKSRLWTQVRESDKGFEVNLHMRKCESEATSLK